MSSKALTHPDLYENEAWLRGKLVCGIDEVGRGCLAGPLVVAAVILPADCSQAFKDSKKMTPRGRDAAFAWLQANSWYAVAYGDHDRIQTKNIYQATLQAMRQAVLQLAIKHPQPFNNLACITVDAMPLVLPEPLNTLPVHSFIKGEDYSRSIAAASIVAKVTRDRLMSAMNQFFPAYQFAQDKAYASPTHCAVLKKSPATFIHRPQFIQTVRTPKEKKIV